MSYDNINGYPETIECHGCENRCLGMDVHIRTSENKPTRAFVVCEDPEMQEQMGIIQIPLERLLQWDTYEVRTNGCKKNT